VTASGVSVSTTYSDAFTFSSSDFGIHYDGATGLIFATADKSLIPRMELPSGTSMPPDLLRPILPWDWFSF
jgi:hypothetical protein